MKHYSIEETKKMLPLVKSYCKSFSKTYLEIARILYHQENIMSITSLSDKKKIKIKKMINRCETRSHRRVDNIKRWRKEVEKMNMRVCSLRYGIIDIPVYDDIVGEIIMICVDKSSTRHLLRWHFMDSDYSGSNKYWG